MPYGIFFLYQSSAKSDIICDKKLKLKKLTVRKSYTVTMYCNNKRISLVSRLTTVFLALAVFSSNADILRNEADIRQHIHTMPNSSSVDFQSFLSSLVDESRNDMILRAEKALEEGLKDIYQGFNVSDTCLNHTEMILQGLVERQDWALRSK